MNMKDILSDLNSQPQDAESLRDLMIELCNIVKDHEREIVALKRQLARVNEALPSTADKP